MLLYSILFPGYISPEKTEYKEVSEIEADIAELKRYGTPVAVLYDTSTSEPEYPVGFYRDGQVYDIDEWGGSDE